ncbi:MAG: hypothetical protein J0M35_19680 [Candidatus Obscuribacter phosphatis]|uniref:Uncharacterized protein n=1 Tax=Candidatus Obscuribacter phosphatis TaxID=1906157 RepID=A0A8J7PA30_9BACT|nr:hypothetical protein [Candidatus Obscuribacter phosphatis]
MVSDDKVPIEIVLELPEILDAPVLMPSGEYLAAGDSVEHPEFGVGKVVRIATYHDDLGIVLRIEYPDSTHKTLGLNFVKKVSVGEKSPGGGSLSAT